MPLVRITPRFWVMPQPSLDQLRALGGEGFAKIINNRPDGEEAGQPGSDAELETCRAVGLSYAHIPVTADGMTEQDAARFQTELAASPGPVVAHCRTRARSFFLWLMTDNWAHLSDSEILAQADRIGLARAKVSERLDACRARRAAMTEGAQ